MSCPQPLELLYGCVAAASPFALFISTGHPTKGSTRGPQTRASKTNESNVWMLKPRIPHVRLSIAIPLILLASLAAVTFYIGGSLSPDALKLRLLTEINRRIGCTGECRYLDVSLFPKPKAIVHDAAISFENIATVTVRSITILPRILPLVIGKVEIAEVDLEAPTATIRIPQIVPSGAEGSAGASGFTSSTVQDTVFPLFALLASQGSNSVIRINKGVLNFDGGTRHSFQIEDLSGELHYGPDKLGVDILSTSSLWDKFSLKAWIDPKNLTSEGRIKLDGFHPQTLFTYLFPSAPRGIGDSRINAEVSFTSGGPKDFQAEFRGSVPALSVVHGPGEYVIRGETVLGALRISPQTFNLSVTQLTLQDPQINLTGSLQVDSDPHCVSLLLEARDTDIASVRRTALVLGGENRKIRKVFEIVKGGRIPRISLTSEADSIDKLFDPNHFVITGNIADGEVYVPRPNLHVEDVRGDVLISQGLLKGSDLHGKTGSSPGSNGNLIVGLIGDDPAFHLDIDIDANLVDLPPVLFRVVKNQDFLRELSLAKDIKGMARGKLILGERLEDIDTKVETREFTLSANYQRLSHPFEVAGDAFLLDKSLVTAKSLVGTVGRSSFSEVSVAYSWRGAPQIEVTSDKPAQIVLNEFYPWLMSHDTPRDALHAFSSAEGILWVDRFDLKGPLFDMNRWQLKAAGRVENALVTSGFFPGPVRTARGRFEATKDTLSLIDFQSESSDASLLATIRLTGYLQGLRTVETTASGNIGQHAHEWICELIHLPSEYRMRPPLSVSQAHLSWEKDANVTFKADLGLQGGMQTSLDLLVHAGNLTINRLSIKDKDSDAIVSLALREKDFDFTLDGTLNKTSADRLFANNQLLDGRIKGNVKCRILPDDPLNSTANGRLDVEGFEYFWKLRPNMRIERASLLAAGRQVNLLSSSFDWGDSHLMLSGKVDFSPAQFNLDLDVIADNLDWDQLRRPQSENGGRPKDETVVFSPESLKYHGVPLRGTARIKTDLFTYRKLSWGPFSASLAFQGDSLNIDITDANLCGVQTPGRLELSAQKTRLDIKPTASNADLDAALLCLWDKHGLMDGTFSLGGTLTADSFEGGLLKSLHGELEFTALRGRIYRFELLSKIFAMLNLTEVYRGQLPDTLKEGCPYDTIKAGATLREGKLKLHESVVDGPCVRMVWKGEIDLNSNKIDATVLVSPLKTVDTIISHVPLIGGILGGSLVSIPVGIGGAFSDPDVLPLAPSAVGSELVGYMKRTFQLPFKLIQPLL